MNEPIISYPYLYAHGMNISWVDSYDVSISPGQVRDYTNSYDIYLNDATILNSHAIGLNGLDNGSLAGSSVYAVYVVANSAGYANKPTGVIMSLNLTNGPVLPSGYDIVRRIGWYITDSSTKNLKYFQSGSGLTRDYQYESQYGVLSGASSTVFEKVSLTGFVPPQPSLACFAVNLNAANIGDAAYLRAGGSTAAVLDVSPAVIGNIVSVPEYDGQIYAPYGLEAGDYSVDYAVSDSSDVLFLSVVGFVDNL